ncbi:TIGR03086 family metal-binding protein [Nocardioides ferulae]|uniref:TIGR03086 family metal-binding protein n=1 Tax=Nocardioides ferulae TaxID=2340821 RepID=UPI000EAE92BA|nr:TIGR03086 family metal-binding protein [Nocardioides ferulae]
MSRELDAAVELLDRSLAYTRVALAGVTSDDLGRSTPCAGWSLARLLAHMEDALDAFTEAAGGAVGAEGPADRTGARVDRLQAKACRLLGSWTTLSAAVGAGHSGGGSVAVGDRFLAAPLLVGAAALEITVHGWDVGRATGRGGPVPESLASELLEVAAVVVPSQRRDGRFGEPVPLPAGADAADLLPAFLGRHPSGPPSGNPLVPAPPGPPGS